MSIYEEAENVKTKKDFEEFLKLLKTNYLSVKEDWTNDTLESFLEGLYGYNYDSDIEEKASWKLFAEILLASRVYE
jgi:hypothetical protein